ncbi:hypothetical protein G7Y89_g15606 [Cudoniella acicularis]|uniref:Uncharacterized protein n=1 Tax=Cudoniella acicularis TaxID=354080 RepID=A0A8H4QKH3_9HELO|nr:hypothetical protein G7Y89_g15606 [Cudoniella acicularis]
MVSPDVRASDNSTALHLAATTGQEAVVKLLVNDAKADLKSVNGSGYDALELAAQSGFSDIVEFLLGCNGSIDEPAPDGNTTLHLAVEFGHPITSQALLKVHENIGLTPIHLAPEKAIY